MVWGNANIQAVIDKVSICRYSLIMSRKHLLLIVVIAGIAFFGVLQFRKPAAGDVRPEVLNVSRSQATIAWLSETVYKGRVFYRPAGSNVDPLEAMDSFGPSDRHEVIITGLNPSARYTYWIGKSKSRFQFQTQPASAGPFSFLMVAGSLGDQIVSLVSSEVPEFIISFSDVTQQTDGFSEVRPYIPIYGGDGVDSPFLRAIGRESSAGLWKLDWGGLRLIFADGSEKITMMFDAPAAHTLGVVSSTVEIDKEAIKQSKLHLSLAAHNKRVSARQVAFVAVVGESKEAVEIDSIQYFGIGTDIAVRVDVDVESARAVFLDDGREVVLKSPPLKEKRTCAECRRLADKGAYEDSIKAYKDFIENHQGHFQISDAYFAIASIYDEKLFNFSEALRWYKRLLDEYPTGTRVPLAKQRIKYLSTYSDHNYEPLAEFDRIRKIEFARKKHIAEERNKLLVQVESTIKKYPDSKLAPAMQYWLANQYRQSDADKAVQAYRRLRDAYPDSPLAQEVLIEIGQTYYDASRFDQAIEVYTKAITELPAHRETIEAQITRSMRNIRRSKIAWICWGILAVIAGVTILIKPIGIDKSRISWAIIAFVVLEVILLFGAWLIREQFISTREMLLITTYFSAAAGIASLVSITFGAKIFAKAGSVLPAVIGSITGMVFLAAAIYLAIYYVSEHYLIVIGM
ncbi:MAG TPA: tetratricopeptide repeat protein [Phycisphaerales bacterium]|nr:tetratricopeptide repeat protein [Phycisphaerales bacterium]